MLETLKKEVLVANFMLPEYNLVTFTWGNVSGLDKESNLMVIKPSGVEYKNLTAEEMVVVEMQDLVYRSDRNGLMLKKVLRKFFICGIL